jgi:RNA polymerase sigma-70 factor (ECF subfamily)
MREETELIQLAKRGNHVAFRELYDAHVTPLFRFLKQFSDDREEVKDWVQRAFIKSYERLEAFDGRSRFSSWLFRIGINEMKMDRRRDGIVEFISVENEASESPTQMSDDLQWNEVMGEWLYELETIKRMVFLLYEVEGYTHAEIGSMLNIGESTSRSILSRTKQWLKNKWQTEEKR